MDLLLLLSAIAFFVGAVCVAFTPPGFRSYVFWVLVGVGLFVLAGAGINGLELNN